MLGHSAVSLQILQTDSGDNAGGVGFMTRGTGASEWV